MEIFIIKHYITEVEKQNRFYEKNCAKSLYWSYVKISYKLKWGFPHLNLPLAIRSVAIYGIVLRSHLVTCKEKLSDLDSKTVEQDKAWYADCDPNTNEPKTTAQMFFTVYYAEKGDKMLHHFQGKIDIGSGNGGIISQLKMQNEMKLTDESWISYQQGKGNEEY